MAKIDYRTRPAKHIQRRMLIDACRRLTAIAPLAEYRYVGFGGLEFLDFDLFHRAMGIASMVSIEKEIEAVDRYKFNRPFATIELRFGPASDELPQLDWSGRNIVWLDYEQQLDTEVLADTEYLSGVLTPGSVLMVTLNAKPGDDRGRLDRLIANVGEDRVPIGLADHTLGAWNLAAVQRLILVDAISGVVRNRASQTWFRQLFNFRYQDGMPMQTIGGIFGTPQLDDAIERCRFDDLEFVRRGDEPLTIRVPVLTAKELHHLNRQLPLKTGADLHAAGLKDAEKQAYAILYRWYPAAL
jgi:hypothetical protein